MAIDSENKRRSTHGYIPWCLLLPIPDGTISEADRYSVSGLYSGVAGWTVTGNINTENKRRSVQAYCPCAIIAPVADGAIGARDRYAMGWIYSGMNVPSLESRKTVTMTGEVNILIELLQ